MSIRLVKAALGLPLSSTSKLILVVLAEHANEEGICWPATKRIAQNASVSPRSAKRLIRQLEQGGFLSVIQRFRDDGSQTSNKYHLRISEGGRDDG